MRGFVDVPMTGRECHVLADALDMLATALVATGESRSTPEKAARFAMTFGAPQAKAALLSRQLRSRSSRHCLGKAVPIRLLKPQAYSIGTLLLALFDDTDAMRCKFGRERAICVFELAVRLLKAGAAQPRRRPVIDSLEAADLVASVTDAAGRISRRKLGPLIGGRATAQAVIESSRKLGAAWRVLNEEGPLHNQSLAQLLAKLAEAARN